MNDVSIFMPELIQALLIFLVAIYALNKAKEFESAKKTLSQICRETQRYNFLKILERIHYIKIIVIVIIVISLLLLTNIHYAKILFGAILGMSLLIIVGNIITQYLIKKFTTSPDS